jgi:hypothetical protein
LKAFRESHHLTWSTASALLGGLSALSNEKERLLKSGRFTVAPDLSHARAVVRVTDKMRAFGVRVTGSLVGAV